MTHFEPARRIRFEGVSDPYRCGCELRPMSADASTLICFNFEILRLESSQQPFEGLIRDALRSGVDRTVRTLKGLLEAEALARAA